MIFEVSSKAARHAWRRQPPRSEELVCDELLDWLAPRPGGRLEQREQLEVHSAAIGDLTDRQRKVFVAIALNDVPIDVLALELGSNRDAIYKDLFDARRTLRSRLAAPNTRGGGGRGRMTDRRPRPGELLRAKEGDAGCTAGEEILDAYVELELSGEDPARVFPATAIHLEAVLAAGPTTTGCWRRRAASATSVSADRRTLRLADVGAARPGDRANYLE